MNSRLTGGSDLNAPTASQEKYNVKKDVVVIGSPVGLNTTVTARSRTRYANQKTGYNLVELNKNASAYSIPECHGSDQQSKNNKK